MAEERRAEGRDMVWLGNYGYYNEGELVGAWLALPYDEAALPGFLADRVGVDEWHEEFGIFDVDLSGPLGRLGVRVGEAADLGALNALAGIAAGVEDGELGRVAAFIDAEGFDRGPTAVANVLAQRHMVPAHPLTGPARGFSSDLERLGRTVAEEEGGVPRLPRETRLAHFDFGGYGAEALRDGVSIVEGGYLVPGWCGVDEFRFGVDEALEALEDHGTAGGADPEAFGASLARAFGAHASPGRFDEVARGHGREAARGLEALLGAAVDRLTPLERRAAAAYVRECFAPSMGPLELANLLLQLDEVHYRPLPEGPGGPEERLGRALAEEFGLDDRELDRHFDFEGFGADLACSYSVSGDYYIDCAADYPLEDRYDVDELREMRAPAEGPAARRGQPGRGGPSPR